MSDESRAEPEIEPGSTWRRASILLPFLVGEHSLFTASLKGVRCHPALFSEPEQFWEPPREVMALHGTRVAQVYDCPLPKSAPRLSIVDGYLRYVESRYRHYYVEVTGSMDHYLEKFSPKTLSTLKRKVRRFTKANEGSDGFRVFSGEDQMHEFFEMARPVSDASYQQALFGDGLPTLESFLRRLREEYGDVYGFLLTLRGRPVAYNLCPVSNETMLYDYTGYDLSESRLSPGTVLQFRTLEWAFNHDAVKLYDLCTGEGRHKEQFATGHRKCGSVVFSPLSLKYSPLVLVNYGFAQVIAAIRTVLKWANLKDRLKKALRRAGM